MAIIRTAFVIGHPIGHSRSPLIHRTWLARHGIAGDYRAVDVTSEKLPDFLARLRAGEDGFVGGNVTLPHKEAVFQLADHRDGIAEEIGAVNTLWREGDRICATNTDAYGFAANLDQQAPDWDRGGIAVVLGAGGASRAVVQALSKRPFEEIRIANRTYERAEAIATRFGGRSVAIRWEALAEAAAGAAFLVNTTSLSMGGPPGQQTLPPMDLSRLADGAVVNDIVYTPLVTPLLEAAAACGHRVVDGLGMLLHQAVPGFTRWFGTRPDVDAALRRTVIEDLAGRS